jgi:hypothetical protein
VEGSIDSRPYATAHEDLTTPIAAWIVGQWATEERPASTIARIYGEALRRTLRRYPPGGGIIHTMRQPATIEVGAWGEGAHGRLVIVRTDARTYETPAP